MPKRRDDRKPKAERITVIGPEADLSEHWEYRCKNCKQLRYHPSKEMPTKCGNCGRIKLIIGRPGTLSEEL